MQSSGIELAHLHYALPFGAVAGRQVCRERRVAAIVCEVPAVLIVAELVGGPARVLGVGKGARERVSAAGGGRARV